MNPRLFKLMRQAAGLTQRDLAAELGVSTALICLMEKGERRITEPIERKFREIVGMSEESEIMAKTLLGGKAK